MPFPTPKLPYYDPPFYNFFAQKGKKAFIFLVLFSKINQKTLHYDPLILWIFLGVSNHCLLDPPPIRAQKSKKLSGFSQILVKFAKVNSAKSLFLREQFSLKLFFCLDFFTRIGSDSQTIFQHEKILLQPRFYISQKLKQNQIVHVKEFHLPDF